MGKNKFIGSFRSIEGSLGMNGAGGIDQLYALSKLVDFGLSGGAGVGVDLAVGVGETDIVPVDEGEGSDTGSGEGFGCPGTNASYANDSKMCLLKSWHVCVSV